MKWVTVGEAHWNTNLIQAFSWGNRKLFVWWHGDGEANPEAYKDPDRVFYKRLCLALGVAPVEVVPNGKS